ncbi:isoprenylcysteine carboxylmethyltransferase family protein [Ruminococcaceae bacterium OttesenSCG-928-I18]|nr:isoprenylcysteine carboxylmethyltransferase family protein [Ruminococcaceae bacterium OttesenSCG-928-I18]
MLLKAIPLLELPLLIALVLSRSILLRRQGVKAVVFGKTDKSDFLLLPVILLFVYSLLAALFGLPFPALLLRPFWQAVFTDCIAVALCTGSLVWFALTLKAFGRSFRVGIDEGTRDELITDGTFSLSRNPLYVAFIAFFLGFFLSAPNCMSALFLLFLTTMVHRQILREKKFLAAHYGAAYEQYCARVRRYL